MYRTHEHEHKLWSKVPINVGLTFNQIHEWHYLNQGIVRSSSNSDDVGCLQILQALAKLNLCILEIDGDSWTARISE